MLKRTFTLLAAVAALFATFTQAAHAQTDALTWQAEYWSNTALDGQPAVERDETGLDHNWDDDAPVAGIDDDTFSARWETAAALDPGIYAFSVTADDGVRVYVDDQLLIDEWQEQSASTYTAFFTVSDADDVTSFRVEYFEAYGNAVLTASWEPFNMDVSADDTWTGVYYDNISLTPPIEATDEREELDFLYDETAPVAGVGEDTWSAVWTRSVEIPADGIYRFSVLADDGVRLYVDNQLVINAFIDQSATTYTADVSLEAGTTDVTVAYYERTGDAVLDVTWERLTDIDRPDAYSDEGFLVDNSDPRAVTGGPAWVTRDGAFDNGYQISANSTAQEPPYEWMRWYINDYTEANPGQYEVWVYIPTQVDLTDSARYWVHHFGGYTQTVVDQQANQGEWISLGEYRFGALNHEAFVSLSDVTGEPEGTTNVAFDAVQIVPAP
jgi:hypothetical protein